MARISILGAGAMGLAAAYHAAKAGHEVDVFEAGDEPGGMAAHFDFDGLSIERFYHFVCKSDTPTFALLEELGLKNAVIWRNTSMGYATLGGMYRWGDPLSLMRFPKLDLMSKLRYGALMYLASKRERWDELEQQSARDWITRWCGSRVWDILWARLFELKFDRHADHVSAAWIWRRIHRLSRSRASLFQEQLGYIEGGTETLVHALVAAIEQFGGRIHLSSPAKRVLTQKDSKGYEAVQTVVTATRSVPCDHVISTVPVQFVPDLVPTLPEQTKQAYRAIQNSGVICVLLKLARPVSPHFWVNIAEPNLEAAGIIEFSNLRPVDHAVVYVPFYVSHEHPRWRWSDDRVLREAMAAVRQVNPSIGPDDVLSHYIGRLKHAQPICPPGFAAMIPAMQTPIRGLQVADTCFYYPEDRGIAESVRLGRIMAAALPAA